MNELPCQKIKQAVIIAGGLGKRLRPLTNDRPKPMVLVNSRPFLEYIVKLLKKNGIKEIILLLGYLPEKVIEHFGDGSEFGIKISYVVSPVYDQNGTRLKKAAGLLDDIFLVAFGDVYWPLNLDDFFAFYRKMNLPAAMAVYDNNKGDGEYEKSNVEVSSDGYVTYYKDFSDDLSFRGKGLDICSYILRKEVVHQMPEEDFIFQNFLSQLIVNKKLAGYVVKDKYYTITTPELVKKVEKSFKNEVN